MGINTDTAMYCPCKINRNIIASGVKEEQSTGAYRYLNIGTNLIAHIRKETTIQIGTDEEASPTSIVLSQRRNSHHSYCQN